MPRPLKLDPDRLFPADPSTRSIARSLYGEVAILPIVARRPYRPACSPQTPPDRSRGALALADHYLYPDALQ